MKIIEFLESKTKEIPQKIEYFPLRSFYETTCSEKKSNFYLEPHLLEEFYMVFVDGEYREELSCVQEGIVVLPKKRAMQSYGAFIQKRAIQERAQEKDPFYLLNCEQSVDAGFVFIPPNTSHSPNTLSVYRRN